MSFVGRAVLRRWVFSIADVQHSSNKDGPVAQTRVVGGSAALGLQS